MTTDFLCGGKPSDADLAQVARFKQALAQPTPEGTRLELLRQMADDGDSAAAEILATHDRKTGATKND